MDWTVYSKLRGTALVAAVGLMLSLPAVHAATLAASGLTLGDAGPASGHNWAVFTTGAGILDLDTDYGASTINGDVGAAGNGNFVMFGGSTITGGLYNSTGGIALILPGSTVAHGITSNAATNSILKQGVTDARALSTKASGLAANHGGGPAAPSSITSSATLGDGDGSSYVFKLTNFTLSNANSVVTLDGNSSSSFVFDISGTFALSGKSKIVLEGGLTAANVLFNYTGGSPISISGGSSLQGIILAASASNYASSNVQLSGGSSVTGEVIASEVTISGGSKITQGIVSP